jgi:iron complex outermembrane receptor protein
MGRIQVNAAVTLAGTAALVWATNAAAQMAPASTAGDAQAASDSPLQEVVVTGTRVNLTAEESTSTVQVLTKVDIERLGVTNVADLLNSLSSAGSNNTLSDITGSNTFAPGASSIGLRNLGEQSTLVLLNGRRVAPNALADYNLVFTNVDAFPLDAIDHVEVLTTGASAIYGSDAVAGVINIITRNDFQGLEVRADRQQSLLGDKFPTTTAALTAGIGNKASDGYNVMLNVNYFDRASVMYTDYLGEINGHLTQVSSLYNTPSTYSPYGNFIDTNTGDVQAGAGCPAQDLKDGLCYYNRYDRFQAVPQSRRLQTYLNGEVTLGNSVTGFFEGTYGQDNTAYVNPYPVYGAALSQVLLRNGTNFYYMELNPQSALNPFGEDGDNAEFRYRFTDAPNQSTAQNSQFRVLTGLKGNWSSVNWESAVGYMGSREAALQEGAFSASAFQRYIGCYQITCATIDPDGPGNATVSNDPNFLNQPGGYRVGGPNSAALLNALFPEQGYTGKYTQAFWDGKLSGNAFALPAGDAQYAAGAEIRHEHYTIDPTQNLVDGDIVGYGVSSVDSARTFGAAFGELSVPVTRSLLADAAVRLDKYEGFGAHFSPKAGFNWQIVNGVRLRGNWSEGFRAPNLVESANAVKVSYAPGTADPARCPAAQNLINALYNQYDTLPPGSAEGASILARVDNVYNNECNNSLFTNTNGNPNLKPETSHTFSVGFVFDFSTNTQATLDYWNIKRDNTISELSGSQIVTLANAGQALPPGTSVTRGVFNPKSDPSFSQNDTMLGGINDFTTFGVPALGQLQGTTTTFANLYSQKTSGIDLAVKAHLRLTNTWALEPSLNATYLLDYHDASISNYSENLAGQYGFPKLVSNFTLGLVHRAWDTGFRVNYTDGYLLQEGSVDTNWTLQGCLQQGLTAQQCHVNSNTTVDYFLVYNPTSKLVVTFNMLNIAAHKAPPDFKAFGGTTGVIPPTSTNQDIQGRFIKLGVSYKIF